jgi:hypothetical protein
MSDIPTTRVLSIADCGHDEYWLRDKIYADPSILGLGELQAVMKERTQSQGGRLDLLLKDPADDSMYEVELQLRATDESHIIRTIEYWDNEKRRWPNRSHTAVLVAEEITNRFFNVVHLLSSVVPIIGIRANLIQVGDVKEALHFTKVIDLYEEPEDIDPTQKTYDEKHWVDNYPGTLACARWYRGLLERCYGEVPTKYFEYYISFAVGGTARVWVSKRKNDRALIEVKYSKDIFTAAVDHLNKEGMAFGPSSHNSITFNVSLQQLKEKQAVHEWIVQQIAPQSAIKPKP